jgi:hypothetical protein
LYPLIGESVATENAPDAATAGGTMSRILGGST